MALFNGGEDFIIALKGDGVHIRYSESADGRNFTKTWSEGQKYIGFAVAQSAPADKEGYTWCKFVGEATSESIQLATPYVSIATDGIASWQEVPNAKGYCYKILNGTTLVKSATTTSNTVTLESGQSIAVMAVGNGGYYTDSEWSIKKTYTAPKAIYYGVGTVTGETDNPFTGALITSLTSKKQTTRICSFTASPKTQYIYFVAPKSYCIDSNGNNVSVFTVNNFRGGFLAPQTLAISGVDYYIYRSVQKLTGDVPVNVT